MSHRNRSVALISACFALSLSGCGSGNSSSPSVVIVPPPATTNVVAAGPISGFGSVIVNGIEFATGAANVTMDGAPGIVDDLRVGMIASVQGTIEDATGIATATDIVFVDDAQGVITSLDAVNNSFVVLGRTVLVDEATVFTGATFDTLAVGNVVEVSGLWRSQERVQATYIERKSVAYMGGMEMEVKGRINGLDEGQQRFNIGTQPCDYSASMLELGGATLADGLYVEVSSSEALSNGDMILDRIEARDRDRDRDRLCESECDLELEGYVTRFVSPTDFDVDGFGVTTTASTTYVNGTVDTLALDQKLGVDGTVDANGVLVADRIVFRLQAFIQIEANLEAIDAAASSATALGIEVTTNASTSFRDDSDLDIRQFGLDDLAIGDRIEVRAYLDGATVTATRLERDDASDTVTLKALVETIAQPDVTLLGVTVTSDQNTVFQNELRETINADAFFALVTLDSVVKAEGTYDGVSILATKLFLRDCDDNCL